MESQAIAPHRLRPDGHRVEGAGIGLRAPHYREVIDTQPDLGWLEVHSENFFGDGGQPLYFLEQARQRYPLSLHGVGMSLGGSDPLRARHLDRLAALVERFEPALVSEHLCWSSTPARHLNDLLPLPYTEEALDHLCLRVAAVQERLGRRILVENVSSYLRYRHETVPEWEFVAAVSKRTGCGILLDVNNIYVSACNHGFDARRYLDALPLEPVQEIHLAGFTRTDECLIDTHGTPVAEAVWELYAYALRRFGPVPTLIERDTDIPPLAELLAEARRAARLLASPP